MTAPTKDKATESATPDREPFTAPSQDELIRDLTKTFKMLSDETRLRILLYLMQNQELHVRALCERLGQSQPAVSHHLAMMRTAGILEARRDGKHNFYRILPDSFQRLLGMMVDAEPHEDNRVRFREFELTYHPPVRPK